MCKKNKPQGQTLEVLVQSDKVQLYPIIILISSRFILLLVLIPVGTPHPNKSYSCCFITRSPLSGREGTLIMEKTNSSTVRWWTCCSATSIFPAGMELSLLSWEFHCWSNMLGCSSFPCGEHHALIDGFGNFPFTEILDQLTQIKLWPEHHLQSCKVQRVLWLTWRDSWAGPIQGGFWAKQSPQSNSRCICCHLESHIY